MIFLLVFLFWKFFPVKNARNQLEHSISRFKPDINTLKLLDRKNQNIPHLKSRQRFTIIEKTVYMYEVNANDTDVKLIYIQELNNLKFLKSLVDKGYTLTTEADTNHKYIIADKLLSNNSLILINSSLQISKIYTINYDFKGLLTFINQYVIKIYMFIVIISLFFRLKKHKLSLLLNSDVSILFIASNGRIITPFPYKLPLKIRNEIKKIILSNPKQNFVKEVFVSQINSVYESYVLVFQYVSETIIQISVIRVISSHQAFESETVGIGTYFRTDLTELKPVEAKLRFGSDLIPSAEFDLIADYAPCRIVIKPGDNCLLPLGIQSTEIDRYISIQQDILQKGLKANAGHSYYVSLMREAYERMGFSNHSLFLLDEQKNLFAVYNFCEDVNLRNYLRELSLKFQQGLIREEDFIRETYCSFRLAYHIIVVESTKYLSIISCRAHVNIMRSVEVLFHAVMSVLITHNHSKLIHVKSTIEYEDLLYVQNNSRNLATVERNPQGNIRIYGNLFGNKCTTELGKQLFESIDRYQINRELNEISEFIFPFWMSNFDCHFLRLTGRYVLSKITGRKIYIALVSDVSEILQFDKELLIHHLSASMMNFQRVNGTDYNLELRQFSTRIFNELPPSSFMTLTKISDLKKIIKFSTESNYLVRLIKEDSSPVMAQTVPVGNSGDFFFYPIKNLSKTLEYHKITSFTDCNVDKNEVRVSFMDLISDSFLDFRIQASGKPKKQFNIPQELAHCKRCANHLDNLASCIYASFIANFYLKVEECFNFGSSSLIAYLQENDKIRPFLISMTLKNSIFCVIFTSLEYELYLTNKVSLVQTAMDAFGTTGRIFPYKYEFTKTPDRDYTTSPSGFSPVLLSETSYKNIYLPEHRELMRKQISAGKVEMVFIVKYETLKWYLSKGSMYGDEIRGVCVNIPDYLVKSKYSPQKMINLTNVFKEKYNKLAQNTGEDMTAFDEAVKDVLKAWRIEN